MVSLRILEIRNTWDNDFKDEVIRDWVIEGETKHDCFVKAYGEVRSLRYCNGYTVRFFEPDIQEEFMEWRKTNVTIEMYYGGGVVD